jgi:hypothetical protein
MANPLETIKTIKETLKRLSKAFESGYYGWDPPDPDPFAIFKVTADGYVVINALTPEAFGELRQVVEKVLTTKTPQSFGRLVFSGYQFDSEDLIESLNESVYPISVSIYTDVELDVESSTFEPDVDVDVETGRAYYSGGSWVKPSLKDVSDTYKNDIIKLFNKDNAGKFEIIDYGIIDISDNELDYVER